MVDEWAPLNVELARATLADPRSVTSLLLIEDNAGDARLLREMLNEPGADRTHVTHVGTMAQAEIHLAAFAVDIILLDLGLPDAQGLSAITRAHAAASRTPLVVLTGTDDEGLATQALQEGAQDYLIKGQIETRGLMRALRYAIERHNLEEALYVEKERAEVTLKSIGEAVVCTDVDGNVTFLNLIAEVMTGWTQAEALGQPVGEVLQLLDAGSREPILRPVDPGTLATGLAMSSNLLVRRDGREIGIEDSVAPIHDRDGRPTGAVVVFRDVTTARAMSLEMTHAAQHDVLTGLPNRLLVNDRISQAIALAVRNARRVGLLFLDVDGFKHINDSLGHPVGDRLLQSIADRLVGCSRATDTVSRQGGDEFVVLLSDMEHAEDAAVIVRRMLESVAQTHVIDGRQLHVTASIGISIYPEDGLDPEGLIKNADTAMYQAKESGRHTFRFFMPEMNVRAVERQSTEEDLRRGLWLHEFRLHYQPKVDLRTGAVTGAEALIRWEHPTRGLVPPGLFIPVAEDCGLIRPIGAWALREACSQAQMWVEAGLPRMTIAVNVSAIEFQDPDFLEGVLDALATTGLDPRLLELELTESVLMRRADSTPEVLHALRERGVRVSIDDFGTGYSSLSYLSRFPVDALKIDQSFVRQITTTGEATKIVTAVIQMAHSLNLRVIAEGVETEAELAFLQEHECDEAQGYLYSRPIPADAFARLLAAGVGPVSTALTTDTPSSPSRSTHRVKVRRSPSGTRNRVRREPAPGPQHYRPAT